MTDGQKPPGVVIAFHRRRLGLSQSSFGFRIDRSANWVSQVERGVRVIDRLSVLERVAVVLGISPEELGSHSPGNPGPPDLSGATDEQLLDELSRRLIGKNRAMPGPVQELN